MKTVGKHAIDRPWVAGVSHMGDNLSEWYCSLPHGDQYGNNSEAVELSLVKDGQNLHTWETIAPDFSRPVVRVTTAVEGCWLVERFSEIDGSGYFKFYVTCP